MNTNNNGLDWYKTLPTSLDQFKSEIEKFISLLLILTEDTLNTTIKQKIYPSGYPIPKDPIDTQLIAKDVVKYISLVLTPFLNFNSINEIYTSLYNLPILSKNLSSNLLENRIIGLTNIQTIINGILNIDFTNKNYLQFIKIDIDVIKTYLNYLNLIISLYLNDANTTLQQKSVDNKSIIIIIESCIIIFLIIVIFFISFKKKK